MADQKHAKKKFGGAEWVLVGGLLAVGAFTAALALLPSFNNLITHFWELAAEYSSTHGYLGAFLVSFLGNTTIIVPFPYTAFIVLLGALGLNPFVLGIIAGVGASLGESTSYVLGLVGRGVLRKNYRENIRRLREIVHRRPRVVLVLFFLIGLTPIPDDPFLISFGLLRYNIFRAIIPFAAGKILLTIAFALTGRYAIGPSATSLLDTSAIWLNALTLIGTILVVYIVLKIDWERLGIRVLEGGEKPLK